MSATGKALLASALTLPLVAFVAGVLTAPDPVDPDRSRPVIIGRISDDRPTDDRAPDRSDREDRPVVTRPDRRGDDDRDDDADDADDQPDRVVTPPPRDLDDDGEDDGADDGDDDDDDDSDDRGDDGDDG